MKNIKTFNLFLNENINNTELYSYSTDEGFGTLYISKKKLVEILDKYGLLLEDINVFDSSPKYKTNSNYTVYIQVSSKTFSGSIRPETMLNVEKELKNTDLKQYISDIDIEIDVFFDDTINNISIIFETPKLDFGVDITD